MVELFMLAGGFRTQRSFSQNSPTVLLPTAATPAWMLIVGSAKQAVIGKHSLSDFVNADPAKLKFWS